MTPRKQTNEAELAAKLQLAHSSICELDQAGENPTWDNLELSEIAELLASQHCINLLQTYSNELSPLFSQNSPCSRTVAPNDESSENGKPLDRTIGHYQLQRLLGSGGFAEVYLAVDLKLNRQVAIKIPFPHAIRTEEAQQRFVREAKAAAALDHSNIVSVLDADLDHGTPYIVFEYCQGQTLAHWIAANDASLAEIPADTNADAQGKSPVSSRVKQRQIAQWMHQLAIALVHAHGKGILHRDLKPGNILIAEDLQHVFISDFGMAKDLHEIQQPLLTQEGYLVGTPAYMSPEQTRGQTLDVTSDIFSLGSIFYQLLIGKAPFERATTSATLQAIQNNEMDTASLKKIDRDLSAICLKCLGHNSQDRYPTTHALCEDLQNWLNGMTVTARHAKQMEKLIRWTRNNPALSASISICVLTLLSAFVVVCILWQAAIHEKSLADIRKRDAEEQRAVAAAAQLQAEAERTTAEKTLKVFLSAIDQANPNLKGHRDLTAYEFLNATHSLVEKSLSEDARSRAPILKSLGQAFASIGHYQKAVECQKTALDICITEYGDTDGLTIAARNRLANTLTEQGNLEEAKKYRLAAVDSSQVHSVKTRKWNQHQLATTYLQLGETEKALELLLESSNAKSTDGTNHSDQRMLLPSRLTLIQVLQKQGNAAEALDTAEREWKLRSKQFGESNLRTLRAMRLYADCQADITNYAESIETLTRLCELAEKKLGPTSTFLFLQKIELASRLSEANQNAKALQLFEKLNLELLSKFGPQHTTTLLAHQRHANALKRSGDVEAATKLLKQTYDNCKKAFAEPAHPRTVAVAVQWSRWLQTQSIRDCLDSETSQSPHRNSDWRTSFVPGIVEDLIAANRLETAEALLDSELKQSDLNSNPKHKISLLHSQLLVLILIKQNKSIAVEQLLTKWRSSIEPSEILSPLEQQRWLGIQFLVLAHRVHSQEIEADRPALQDLGKKILQFPQAEISWTWIVNALSPESAWVAKTPEARISLAEQSTYRMQEALGRKVSATDRLTLKHVLDTATVQPVTANGKVNENAQ